MTISAPFARRTAPVTSAKNSAGAPCSHQFLVTLMVQTTKINPTPIIPIRSATSLTTADPILVIARDAQHTGGGAIQASGSRVMYVVLHASVPHSLNTQSVWSTNSLGAVTSTRRVTVKSEWPGGETLCIQDVSEVDCLPDDHRTVGDAGTRENLLE
ncbi:hypothetical protein [Rhodococcus wratislaviensis]|uniref:hypothetical protein n=1 Tax=Rhodococcus wratislaviensis TaxID=44752 RepID=UPI0020D08064|nr:hypothetical protein [Rhodococcus wratislaviensis]